MIDPTAATIAVAIVLTAVVALVWWARADRRHNRRMQVLHQLARIEHIARAAELSPRRPGSPAYRRAEIEQRRAARVSR